APGAAQGRSNSRQLAGTGLRMPTNACAAIGSWFVSRGFRGGLGPGGFTLVQAEPAAPPAPRRTWCGLAARRPGMGIRVALLLLAVVARLPGGREAGHEGVPARLRTVGVGTVSAHDPAPVQAA